MAYLFYIILFILLMTLQTTLLPFFSVFRHFYDLGIPCVIYLAIFRLTREGLLSILFLGLLRDGISGGIFGLYLTVYLWLFITLRWIFRFLHMRNKIVMPFLVPAGVFAGNFILCSITLILEPETGGFYSLMGSVGKQVVWALFTGQIFLLILFYLQKKWELLFRWMLPK